MEKKPQSNKRTILIGLGCILGSFVCVAGIFYVLINTQRSRMSEVEVLQERLMLLNEEKVILEEKAEELQSQAGRSLEVNRIIDQAKKIYGDQEQAKKEGYLWIDRNTDTFLVTLGALNGIAAGDRIRVYNEEEEPFGYLRVETPLDVISYVYPIDKTIKDFEDNYYKVVVEK